MAWEHHGMALETFRGIPNPAYIPRVSCRRFVKAYACVIVITLQFTHSPTAARQRAVQYAWRRASHLSELPGRSVRRRWVSWLSCAPEVAPEITPVILLMQFLGEITRISSVGQRLQRQLTVHPHLPQEE